MRLLGIDYGTRSIGVAISDELGITVRPLTTIRCQKLSRREIIERIQALVEEYSAQSLVIGLPLLSDGSRGPAADKVDRFATALQEQLSVSVVTCNEFLSSREADDLLREQGASAKERRRRSDEYAAAVILQDYLALQIQRDN